MVRIPMTQTSVRISVATLACALLLWLPAAVQARDQQPDLAQIFQVAPQAQAPDTPGDLDWPRIKHEIWTASIRLPLAAILGAALALRPRRRGTPKRSPTVVQTQIMLSVVGAVILLVVGSNLARAFGIVGAANLIRYRSKIDDPKDAVVMLCALAAGLASGAGLYVLATVSTIFMVGALWLIESFEPERLKRFELAVKVDKGAEALRPQVEKVLSRFGLEHEVRTLSDEALSYLVHVPQEVQTDDVSTAIAGLGEKTKVTVEWDEKKSKDK
jgi:MgtC family protein/uncharacterized protein DUF4956